MKANFVKLSSSPNLRSRYHSTFSQERFRNETVCRTRLRGCSPGACISLSALTTALLTGPVMQCSIPVFAGLLPDPHNAQVLRLLFVFSHWHSLAKLRIHTDDTLNIFESVTKELGNCIRSFTSKTCPNFATKELPREAGARIRRQVQQSHSRPTHSRAIASHTQARQAKGLNLQTYKLHALADYPAQIRIYGTTDSYSTQVVSARFFLVCVLLTFRTQGELEHRTSKSRFARTSRRSYVPQMASIERRQARIHRIRIKRAALHLADPVLNKPDEHHVIGESQNFPEELTKFVQSNLEDPATRVSTLVSHADRQTHGNLPRTSL